MPAERFLTYFGPIRLPLTNALRASLCVMVNEGAQKITILFASEGGSTDDGIALYTYLRALPVELTMHAVGMVSSIAVPIFLAAPSERRFASANARFFFHDYTWTFNATTVTGPVLAESSILLATALDWSREIVQAETKLTDERLQDLKLFQQPVVIPPSLAAEIGLIREVAEPAVPAGAQPRVVM